MLSEDRLASIRFLKRIDTSVLTKKQAANIKGAIKIIKSDFDFTEYANDKKIKPTKKIEKDPVRDYTLYSLFLTSGKRYVGITSYKDVDVRMQKHKNGKGAKWTKIYKPIYIETTEQLGLMSMSEAVELETTKTAELMNKYGIANVRGGKFCTVDEDKLIRIYSRSMKTYGVIM